LAQTFALILADRQKPLRRMMSSSTSKPFLRGLRDVMPVLIATFPFGMVYGALAAKQGLTFAETIAMSALVFGGASQFVALELWADPLPFAAIFLSVFAVNLRHVLYSAAMTRRLADWSPIERYVGLFVLTDPTFALVELKGGERLSTVYYLGISLPLYLNWIAATLAGALFGELIRHPEAIGFDFVATAYFIFLVVSFRGRSNAWAVILASAAGSLAAWFAAGSPWHYAGGAAAGIAVATALTSRREAAA
jgi:4-azaleucine resistance transporter AzlC